MQIKNKPIVGGISPGIGKTNYKFPIDRREQGTTNAECVHLVISRMLDVFMAICKRRKVVFWLDYGTLLGAIRHAGIIPWDNEADIGMLREDYNTIAPTLQKSLPPDIFFQTQYSDPAYREDLSFIEGKLRDRHSSYTVFANDHPGCNWHNGIQVDIFLYDAISLDGEICYINSYERNVGGDATYFRRNELASLRLADFEGRKFYIPAGAVPYLTRTYGNFMAQPRPEERVFSYVDVFSPCKHREALPWKYFF